MRKIGDILWPFAPEIEPYFDKIAESKTNVLKGDFEMMNGRKGSGGGAGVPRPEDASRESVAVPPGLTLEELQMLNASPMAGLARSTGVAYERMSGYFQQWCDDRGIELEQVETAHLMVYMVEARRRGAPKGPVSVRWLRTTFTVVKRVLKAHLLAHRVDWDELAKWISCEARNEKSEPVGGARHKGRLHGGQSGDGGF